MKTTAITENALTEHLFSIKEYNLLGEVGIFHEDDRVELIEGRIVDMTPIGVKHASCVKRLTNLLAVKLQERAIISVQDPVILDENSEPQPDIAVLKLRADFYSEKHPGPDDILLIIEVADASIEYDRSIKIPLYAKAGIPEVWIVDLKEESVEAHQDPSTDGYGLIMKRRRGQTVSPKSFPDIVLSVAEILGYS